MSGLWQRLGFQQNPYFTTPIEINNQGREFFVGRSAEIRRMISKWDDPTGVVTVVGGHIGTGKTSFLNVCQYLAMMGIRDFQLPFDPPRLIPSFSKIQLETGISDSTLLIRALNLITESVTQAYHATYPDREIPNIVSEIADWIRSLISSSTTTYSGGFQVLGTGGSGGKTQGQTLRPASDVSVDSLLSKLKEIAHSVRADRIFRGCILAIDNIEMVDPSYVIDLLNKYRDTLFNIPGLWWVLIGQKGLYDLINADAPRVAQRIKGEETTLSGLQWEDFQLAIAARMSAFSTRKGAVGPIGEDLLKKLFDASAGEIRYVFQMADQIATDAIAENPSLTTIPPEFAEALLQKSVKEQIERLSLSVKEHRVLRKICEERETRPKNYKDYGFQNAPNFIQSTLQPLQEKGLLTRSIQGNAALYSPRSLARLAHSFGLLAESEKKS